MGYINWRFQTDPKELTDALEIKAKAQESLALLLTQDDATKTMLIDIDKLNDVSQRKINAYDRNMVILKDLEANAKTSEIKKIAEDLLALDEKEMRVLDTAILEQMFDDPAKAKKTYFDMYSPVRTKFENTIRELMKIANSEATAAVEKSQKNNRQSRQLLALTLTFGVLGTVATIFLMIRYLRKDLDELNRIAEQSLNFSGTIDIAAANALSIAEKQAKAVSDTGMAIISMTENIDISVESTRESLKLAETVGKKTAVGTEIMEKMSGYVQRIGVAIDGIQTSIVHIDQSISEKLNSFGKIIDEINAKTRIIHDIVFQTKLLSFNASVEAARAGDHGKGFAVVAEEIGNLAQTSGRAAVEVDDLLKGSKVQVKEIIESTKEEIGRSRQAVDDGKKINDLTQKVRIEADEIFNSISTDIKLLATKIYNLTSSNDNLKTGIDKITSDNEHVNIMATAANNSATEQEVIAKKLSESSLFLNTLEQRIGTLVLGESKKPALIVARTSEIESELQLTG